MTIHLWSWRLTPRGWLSTSLLCRSCTCFLPANKNVENSVSVSGPNWMTWRLCLLSRAPTPTSTNLYVLFSPWYDDHSVSHVSESSNWINQISIPGNNKIKVLCKPQLGCKQNEHWWDCFTWLSHHFKLEMWASPCFPLWPPTHVPLTSCKLRFQAEYFKLRI